jgi:hypothetical protein
MAKRKPKSLEEVTAGDFAKTLKGNLLQVEKPLAEESPLACAVLGASILENALMTLLGKFLINGETSKNLFDIGNPLDSLSRCTQLAYCLGFIPDIVRQNIATIGQIRNEFAHNLKIIDFKHPDIVKLCNKLTWPCVPLGTAQTREEFFKGHSSPREKFSTVVSFVYTDLLFLCFKIKRQALLEGQIRWLDTQSAQPPLPDS